MNLRKAAEARPCTVMIFGVCNLNPETSVLAHYNVRGLNVKAPDIHACISCSACHRWLDHGYVRTHTKDERDLVHLRAIMRTQLIWIKEGLL